MTQETQPGELPRVTRVIDMKLPLTWLLGVGFMIIAGGFGLYHQIGSQGEKLNEVKDQIKALQIAVNSGNSQSTTLAGEIAILRFRVETLESDKRRAQ
ncbi:hypothetical protein EJP67_18650 [Variovorax guangxiensis]|uniref:Uncharacterized protein n=1 Tax=Variovorax guangxiensis TaxID=1775474 RepID=A0A433MLV7_9BURK|nr:hypothetical protein [Variovorax guangxiensis]RUR69081.1 hypothetical protein EJP67_18650 [Variovorax guangxiensis]